jgi:hypothetical protein
MEKITQWESKIGDKRYVFSHKKLGGWRYLHSLTINGSVIEIPSGYKSKMLGFDEGFIFGEKEARLVIEKGKPDIAIDGVFLQSGKPYAARPSWIIIFQFLCLPLMLQQIGGLFGLLAAFAVFFLCRKISEHPISSTRKLILCIAVTLGSWFIVFVLQFILVLIFLPHLSES